jgi:hypothetical protein
MKMRDRCDGFLIFFPEATPSFEDPGFKNFGSQKPGGHVDCIAHKNQKIMKAVDPPIEQWDCRMKFGSRIVAE